MLSLNIRRYRGFIITLLVILGLATFGYSHYVQSLEYHETRFLFDTEVYIEAHGSGANQAVKEALRGMADINEKLNMYSASSEITLINNAAGIKPVSVAASTFGAIKKAIDIARSTDGAFDPTVGPLVNLWGIDGNGAHKPVPTAEKIKEILPLVGYEKVVLDPETSSVYLSIKGMQLDMGAIAKGYAVEQAVGILKKKNIKSALVAAGGNIYGLGHKSDGSPWRIGIRDPFHRNTEIASLELINQAIDTSGDYEKYYIDNNVKYSHIFDPHTGYPITFSASSSVLTTDPAAADALATALFVLGPDKGLLILAKIPGTEGLAIKSNGDLQYSPGLQSKLSLKSGLDDK